MGQDTIPSTQRQTKPVEIETVLVPVDDIRPNDYNPNRMDDQEFSEFVAEVKHLGRLPKPVVIRPKLDGFNSAAFCIVDGEHGWRAAKEVGFEKIPCELIEADDFEAMRQTYKRNQHGRPNQVLLGQMFQAMMDGHKFSRRQLADAIKVSDGTIRNALEYSEAVRNSYAPEAVAPLSIRQVRQLNELPQKLGRAWLNAGADLNLLTKCIRNPKATQTWEATGLLEMVSPMLNEPEVRTLESWRETFTEWVHTISEWATCEEILLSNDKTDTETIRKYTVHAIGKHADWLSINDLCDIVAIIVSPAGRMKLTAAQFKRCVDAAGKEASAEVLRELVLATLNKRHEDFLGKLAEAAKETSKAEEAVGQHEPPSRQPAITCPNCKRLVEPDEDGDCPECREPGIDKVEPKVRHSTLDELGDLAAPPGSREWAIAVRHQLDSSLHDAQFAADNAKDWFDAMRDREGWKHFEERKGKPFSSFKAYCARRRLSFDLKAVWNTITMLAKAIEDTGIFADEEAD